MKVLHEAHGPAWALYNGDCVEVIRDLPDASVGFSVYSPPFANLYCYSDSERDMGNCADEEQFLAHYAFLVRELHRVLRPGRLVAVHCKELVRYANSHGMAGLSDFPGALVRVHLAAGFAYHSRITLWKSPVEEMHKTKAHGLLYKTLRSDSSFSRQGLAEYVLVFRKWAKDEAAALVEPVTHTRESFPLELWQRVASPVWMDVDHARVLNVRLAREDRDEKHMCPLSLDVIERCVDLWSNPGDVVFSPYAGVGSEGVGAIERGRRFVGIELKESYFRQACGFLADAGRQASLFGGAA